MPELTYQDTLQLRHPQLGSIHDGQDKGARRMVVMDAPQLILGRRYRLVRPLGRGGMGMVYEAADRLTGGSVALKRVTAPADNLIFTSRDTSSDSRIALAGEFQTLASLRHPHIISVLDYGFDSDRQPYFTMEIVPGGLTILQAAQTEDPNGKIRIILELLQALAYLHRRGIVHRDLKPSNILTRDGQVKVLDFGLSITRTQEEPTSSNTTVGTLAYISPEVLNGEGASELSDLYAVGVIAYEILAGHHPFDTDNFSHLMRQVIEELPDVSGQNIDPKLAPILLRLLAKSPRDRYLEAREVTAAISDATGIQPEETIEIRESFIQAAQFVGREAELGQLKTVLTQAMNSRGSGWLIGGESGVGKSRLLNELRTVALVKGVQVLRGQAVSEARSPYQIWRDALRWLAMLVPLDDLEAGVLKFFIPDIATLLGRDIPDAPTLDPQATQERALTVIENVVTREDHPMLILLEDLHWADNDSLKVLERLLSRIQNRPLLIVGSYRDEERPDLRSTLPGIEELRLKKFDLPSIEALSESILGPAGREPRVVQLLYKQSEGNIFFLIEVMRALAERAGHLDKVSQIDLPETISTGGVQLILQRRLTRVSETARALLEVAAVIGRQLDLKLLKLVDGSVNLDQWLTTCDDAAVLEIQDGVWRFAHDKLRERLLAELPQDRRRGLHEKVAKAIEHMDAVGSAAVLAYHWGVAGNKPKELQYTTLAGEQALRIGANEEAITFFKKVLALDTELHLARTTQAERLERATWERKLGAAYYALGRFRDGEEYLRAAAIRVGETMPRTVAGFILPTLRQIARQAFHRAWPSRVTRRTKDEALRLEAIQVYTLLSEAFWFDAKVVQLLYCTLAKLNLAETVGLVAEMAQGYASVSVAAALVPLHSIADNYTRRADALIPKIVDVSALAYAYIVLAAHEVGMAKWEKVRGEMERGLEINKALGDRRRFQDTLVLLGWTMINIGELDRCIEYADMMYESAMRSGGIQHQIWGAALRYRGVMRQGKPGYIAEVTRLAEMVLSQSHAVASPEPGHEIDAHGTLAVMGLREGDRTAARNAATRALELASKSRPTQSNNIDGYTNMCQAFLSLWETETIPAEREAIGKLTKKAFAQLPKLTKVSIATQPAALRVEGSYEWARGEHDNARQLWAQSLALGEKFEMPYEIGATLYEIGSHLDPKDSARRDHLTRAQEIFTKIGALYDLQRTKTALA